ncbi:hypothetical protein RX330_20375 [Bradyrhizobium sp. NDS-1]|uniref:phage tail protein n=1 Tax=Bradyrhizobium sp. NDS-1 TaxID=3080014 RepID=UPI00293EF107|nr:hypothetical protein [Bradyrhizobium sp. NDS-1]WOH70656.1 hypothetical protein RX330_20375 [Bradyrhizobium sp. NDS-1]
MTLVEHDRVLVRAQSTGSENGIYEASSGNWLRTKDFDGAYDIVSGSRVYVVSGAVNAQYEYAVSTAGEIVIDSTAITFVALGAQSATAAAAEAVDAAATAVAAAATATSATFTTGDIKLTLKATPDIGWRMFDDGTIGDGSSGATYANVAAQALFTLMYDNFVDANAAITTSAGAGTTRAAQVNAATAWANHCRIALPKVLGRALAIAGAGSGLTSRDLGVTAGAETHQLQTTEIPSHQHSVYLKDPGHTHTYSVANNTEQKPMSGGVPAYVSTTPSTTSSNATGITIGSVSGTANDNKTATAGGGGSHNNMQPSSFLNAMVKL